MTKIALLCPSRARPEQYKRMAESAAKTGKQMRYIWLGVSEEDAPKYHQDWTRMILPEGMPTVYKWNLLAQEAMKDQEVKLFMLAADDIEFCDKGWDERIIESYNSLKNKTHVWALQDSRDAMGTPHPIFSREWIEAMGWMLPPYFLHFYPDTWSVEIAKANNCFTHLREFKLNHNKPSDVGKADLTHSRIRQMGWNIRDSYVSESCSYILELEKKRLAKAMQ